MCLKHKYTKLNKKSIYHFIAIKLKSVQIFMALLQQWKMYDQMYLWASMTPIRKVFEKLEYIAQRSQKIHFMYKLLNTVVNNNCHRKLLIKVLVNIYKLHITLTFKAKILHQKLTCSIKFAYKSQTINHYYYHIKYALFI